MDSVPQTPAAVDNVLRTPPTSPRTLKHRWTKKQEKLIIDAVKLEYKDQFDDIILGQIHTSKSFWEKLSIENPEFADRPVELIRKHFNRRMKAKLLKELPIYEEGKPIVRRASSRKKPEKTTTSATLSEADAGGIFSGDESSTTKVAKRKKTVAKADTGFSARQEIFQLFFLLVIGLVLFCLGTAERWGGVTPDAYAERWFGPPSTTWLKLLHSEH